MVQYFYFLKNSVVNSVGFGIGQVGAFDADFDPTQIIANEIAREATEGEVEAYLDDQAQLALPHGRVGSLPPGGSEGQLLAKRSIHNFDTEWVDPEGGSTEGLYDDRGEYDASGDTYPAAGGSGDAGAILKGDTWTATADGGTLNGKAIEEGDLIRAKVDDPGQTDSNWSINQAGSGGVSSLEKATGAEVDAGTDDDKYVTALALAESNYIKEADLPPTPVSKIYEPVLFACLLNDFPSATYDNGTDGVGATLTGNVNGTFEPDGKTLEVGRRIALLGQSVGYGSGTIEAGIYVVTQVGDGSTPFILTRATDFDTPEKIVNGGMVTILDGDSLLGYQGVVFVPEPITVGTTSIEFGVNGGIFDVYQGEGILVNYVGGNPKRPQVSFAASEYEFASLPSSPTKGNQAIVTNSTETGWGRIPDGDGANSVLCWFDGNNWSIIGAVGA